MQLRDDFFDRLFARVPFSRRFLGARTIARREIVSNIRSVRLLVVAAIMALAIVGGAFGLSALVTFRPPQNTELVMFAHTAYPNGVNGSHDIVVFVSDAWGAPKAGFEVIVLPARFEPVDGPGGGPRRPTPPPSNNNVTGFLARTNADGLAYFPDLPEPIYLVGYNDSRGQFVSVTVATFYPLEEPVDLSVLYAQFDLEERGTQEFLVLHVTSVDGTAASGAEVMLNGTAIGNLDARGYARFKVPEGLSNVTVRAGAVQRSLDVYVSPPAPTALEQGADVIFYLVAAGLVPFVAPIGAIAIAHDAIARERAQGSIDFVLSRPATRRGIMLGKFVGTTTAILIPLWSTITLSALVVGAVSGKPITGSFLGAILLAVALYIAAYTLIVLILSTAAKSTATAIMFGILLWVIYNFLWGILVYLAALLAGLSQADRAFYEFVAWADLFNVNSVYTGIVSAAYPGGGIGLFSAQAEILPSWAPSAAGFVWLAVLLWLALWLFDRKAAE